MTEYRISFAYIIAAGGTRRNSLVWLIFWGKRGTKLILTAHMGLHLQENKINNTILEYVMQNQHTW